MHLAYDILPAYFREAQRQGIQFAIRSASYLLKNPVGNRPELRHGSN
jgi:hypothetical protein